MERYFCSHPGYRAMIDRSQIDFAEVARECAIVSRSAA